LAGEDQFTISDRKPMRASPGSRYQAHQVECGSPQEAVWIAEGLRQFEMVVVLADQQPHLLTSIFDRSGKFAVLALKLGGLAGAVRNNQRRLQSV
jgi:hypothetical protein